LVRHLMHPHQRREHKTLGQRSPVSNVPMIPKHTPSGRR
jgi:hypothetical protein